MNGCVLTTPRFAVASFFLAAGLVACGGGGGGTGGSPPTVSVTNTPQSSNTTNATGTVVDDSNGSPLAGVRVVLMPWGPCSVTTPLPNQAITPENDDCPTPLPAPQATTNAQGQFALNGAPNGHYLLIIGNDTVSTPPPGYAPPTCTNACGTPSPAPFTVQASVHDNVTLSGGNQALVAPTMPPVPTITPPAWETNGTYRLAMLNASTEMPCYIAWQYERTQDLLAAGSVDEWLVENTRALNTWEQSQNRSGSVESLTTGNAENAGGTDCANSLLKSVAFALASTYAANPHTIWFAGTYSFYAPGGLQTQATGVAEFPIDRRFSADPNYPSWP